MPQTGAGTATRDAIHASAARLFREHGFSRTAVRQIAAAAGADPALVIRHFRSKELLFLETMHLTIDDEPSSTCHWSSWRERQIAERLRGSHEAPRVRLLRARLSGPDADVRSRLAGAMAAGLLYALWPAGDETLLRADRKELVSRYGPLLQEVLTPRP